MRNIVYFIYVGIFSSLIGEKKEKYNDPGRMLWYTGQIGIEPFLRLRSLIAHPHSSKKKKQPKSKSNSTYKIKTC